jgi:hypothetical protein
VCEVPIPWESSCIFHALNYDAEGIGANALRQRTTDFLSDQPK